MKKLNNCNDDWGLNLSRISNPSISWMVRPMTHKFVRGGRTREQNHHFHHKLKMQNSLSNLSFIDTFSSLILKQDLLYWPNYVALYKKELGDALLPHCLVKFMYITIYFSCLWKRICTKIYMLLQFYTHENEYLKKWKTIM